ncbi:hypothetical protein D3C72_1666540 [compost metagenome]
MALRYEPERGEQRQGSQRYVDVEDPRPCGVGHDQAAHPGAENGGDQAGPGDHCNHFDEVFLVGVAQYRQASHGHHQRAADALEHACRYKHL